MGIGFNWFKNYKIIEDEYDDIFGKTIKYSIEYLEGGSTSHSYGNRTKLQNILQKYLNIRIPVINNYELTTRFESLDFIEPYKMSQLCTKLIENKNEYNLEGMGDRIQYIKKLSDDNYYVSYDMY